MSHSCEWVRARRARFLDGALSADEHAAIEAHLHGCAECRAQLEALRETDRLIRDATTAAPARGEADAEGRSFAALQAAIARRYDLDAAAQARAREMAAEPAGAPRRAMSPEEIANAPLDRAILREAATQRARGFSLRDLRARLSLPAPAWRWMAIGVPAAAAAVVAVVLLVREPALHEAALEQALSSATREAPSIAAPSPVAPPAARVQTPVEPRTEPAVAPAKMDKIEGAAPTPAPVQQITPPAEPAPEVAKHAAPAAEPAVGTAADATPAPAEAGPAAEPLRMGEEAMPSDRLQTAEPAPAPSAEAFAAAPVAAPAEEGPWPVLREFVEASRKDVADETQTAEADAEQDHMALLAAAEEQLLTLTAASTAADAEQRSRASGKKSQPSAGGGPLGRLTNLRDAHPERTGLRAEGKGESHGTSETRRVVERPPVRLWLALADGWYLLYRGATAGADATSLAARALAAYEQAAYVPDSLADDDLARVRDRITELRNRSPRR